MKKLLALLVASTMAISLAACGNTATASSAAPAPASESTPASSDAAEPADETPAEGPGIAGTVENPRIITISVTGNFSDPDDPYLVATRSMNEKLMELSGGTLGVELIQGGVYGSTAQHLAQMKAGTLDAMTSGFDLATNLENCDRFYAVAMPYVFNSNEHIDKVIASDLWQEMVDDLAADNGIRIATLFFHQFPRSINTTKRITSPTELAGMKIRVPETDVQVKVWQATGASPVQVPGTEMYSALDTGIADAQENGLTTVKLLVEVAPYFYKNMDYIRQAQLLYMSEKVYNEMSSQEIEWLEEAAKYAVEKTDERNAVLEGELVQYIADNGGEYVELNYDEWKEFFTKIVKEQFDGKLFPAGLYDEIQGMA